MPASGSVCTDCMCWRYGCIKPPAYVTLQSTSGVKGYKTGAPVIVLLCLNSINCIQNSLHSTNTISRSSLLVFSLAF